VQEGDSDESCSADREVQQDSADVKEPEPDNKETGTVSQEE